MLINIKESLNSVKKIEAKRRRYSEEYLSPGSIFCILTSLVSNGGGQQSLHESRLAKHA